ncbi:formylglycine-generating enzyme family protein [Aeoliella sp.]|uniref:formylglycine-generating enzyme family protein n=1 Tax=Aeoliella sp. TaxID=2795800 RepID=UPI003CCBC107
MRLAACLLASLTFIGSAGAKDSVLPRGVVSEKPESGPAIEVEGGYMVPYTETLPGTEVKIEMVPVPGGVFTFGSSPDDEDRGEYELDAVKVELPPFWIAKHELTWEAYWKYMKLNDDFVKLQSIKNRLTSTNPSEAAAAKNAVSSSPAIAAAIQQDATYVDGVTAPTPLYDPGTTYEFGEDPKLPAATMTPYAAKQFTKWLGKTTGQEYRLPTEAEWEYAARAGSTTAYPEGVTADNLGEYAWFEDSSDWSTHNVGELKPNAWGLHDMLGNVAEWVIDEFSEEIERPDADVLSWDQAVNWAKSNEARVLRGGFYDSAPEDCRVTSRFYSDDELWKSGDPNSPLSPWWYTDYPTTGVGMRVVRSLKPLPPETLKRFWDFESEATREDVQSRIAGGKGRGKLGPANPNLTKAQQELESDAVKSLLEGDR